MTRKFDQYCPMAHALSLVGDRWALLIVRELLHGPKRYTDLSNGLPGIGTNILATRLRDLERDGILQKRRLPPPAASTVYELTEYGAALDEPLYALARWGARSLGPPSPDDQLYPEWGVNALPSLFNAEAARGLTETYVLQVGEDVFSAVIESGALRTSVGAVDGADVRAEMDMDTFFALSSGQLAPRVAAKSGCVQLQGDVEAFERCFRVFSLAPRLHAA